MKKLFISLTIMLAATLAYAQETFKNPVVWADMPDPDVIRTGDDFWLVTTTMHLMPGAPIMHSKDLVNWESLKGVATKPQQADLRTSKSNEGIFAVCIR